MSDISLLMTGILLTGQQPLAPLPKKIERDVQALAPTGLPVSPSLIAIAAPEFSQAIDKIPRLPILIQPEIQNLLVRLANILRTKEIASSISPKDLPQIPLSPGNPAPNSLNQPTEQPTEQTPTPIEKTLPEPTTAQRLRSRLVSDGSTVLARYGSSRNDLPVLRFGTTGISVRVLQRLLASNGYGVEIDGRFGALTEAAVKAFQSQQEITIDGIVGQVTWSELTQ